MATPSSAGDCPGRVGRQPTRSGAVGRATRLCGGPLKRRWLGAAAYAAHLIVALAVNGCGTPGGGQGATSWIVEFDTLWRLSSDALHTVRTVKLGDGFVVVANVGNRQLLAVSIKTDRALNIGRFGQGPGEFGTVTDVATSGSDVYVLDGITRSIHRFDVHDSAVFREMRRIPDTFGGVATQLFAWSDKQLGVVVSGNLAPPGTVADMVVHRDTARVIRLGRSNTGNAKLLTAVGGTEYFYGVTRDGRRMAASPAFAARTLVAITSRGVVVADGRSGTIEIHDGEGVAAVIARERGMSAELVTDAELEASRARNEARALRLADPAEFRRLARMGVDIWGGGKPPRPYFDQLLADERTALVRRYTPPEAVSSVWIVQTLPDGRTGSLTVPASMRVTDIRSDTISVVSRDSLDVETVMLLRLRAKGAPR